MQLSQRKAHPNLKQLDGADEHPLIGNCEGGERATLAPFDEYMI